MIKICFYRCLNLKTVLLTAIAVNRKLFSQEDKVNQTFCEICSLLTTKHENRMSHFHSVVFWSHLKHRKNFFLCLQGDQKRTLGRKGLMARGVFRTLSNICDSIFCEKNYKSIYLFLYEASLAFNKSNKPFKWLDIDETTQYDCSSVSFSNVRLLLRILLNN